MDTYTYTYLCVFHKRPREADKNRHSTPVFWICCRWHFASLLHLFQQHFGASTISGDNPRRDPQFITMCMDFWGLGFSIVINVYETIPTFGSFPKCEMPSRNHICHIKSTFPSQVAQHYSGEAKTTTLKKYHPVHCKNIFRHWLSFCTK